MIGAKAKPAKAGAGPPVPRGPVKQLTLDLETYDPPEEAIVLAMENWQSPANLRDPAKVEARRVEAEVKIRERGALLDQAPVACIACHEGQRVVVFNGLNGRPYKIRGVEVVSCGDEKTMLLVFREWLDRITDAATVLVGHNAKRFDLPKLRHRYTYHRLRLPCCLDPCAEEPQQVCDTMTLGSRFFSAEAAHNGPGMISLSEIATKLNLPKTKHLCRGADVPAMVAAKKVREVLAYAALDAALTRQLYLLLTGQAADLE